MGVREVIRVMPLIVSVEGGLCNRRNVIRSSPARRGLAHSCDGRHSFSIYFSALVFAPGSSIIRRLFEKQMDSQIRKAAENAIRLEHGAADARGPQQTGHCRCISRQAASCWRLGQATGVALRTLEGHKGPVNAVAFSLDGILVASASWDRTGQALGLYHGILSSQPAPPPTSLPSDRLSYVSCNGILPTLKPVPS